jgi:uncharacterized protein YndB with AHSA1/START domain
MPEDVTPSRGAAIGGKADQTVTLERLIAASPERVFDAWVDPALLVQWWGPEGFTTPELKIDLRRDGRWRTVLQTPDGERHIVSGVYRIIERPRRLVFTWAWEDEAGRRGHESEVDVTFRRAGGGTRLEVVHRLLDTIESRDSHREGWASSLNNLERLLASRPLIPLVRGPAGSAPARAPCRPGSRP